MGFLLNHLLSDAADKDPLATALRFDGAALTYGATEEQTNRVARALMDLGVRPGDRVGLQMKKTLDAVVYLLGILKAGACAVPLTTSTPASRLRQIIEQCEMRCLVASSDISAKVLAEAADVGPSLCAIAEVDEAASRDETGRIPVVSLPLAAAGQDATRPATPTTDRDLAYVLFTSGSTGRPKGVMLSHRAVLTFVEWAGDEFGVGPDDRLSNHAPLNFDLSTFDIYAALRGGASVTVIPEGLAAFPTRLADLIDHDAITIWYSVPSVLAILATRGGLDRRQLDHLRVVLFAGEVFPIRHLREVMTAVPNARFVNLYGPTETNVCTYFEVPGLPAPDAAPVPIGKACANTHTVVIDEAGEVVSGPGATGFLHVGGSTLMDGYFGLPDETAAMMRDDPSWHAGISRIYNTGDWVSIDDNGDYVFLGRKDHMVKVGGYRVELGEIEASLHSCPGVVDAVAVPIADDLIGTRIRAVVVASDPGLDGPTVRRHCASRLPSYMVPHEVEFRDALPRTSTDKIDRVALAREACGA